MEANYTNGEIAGPQNWTSFKEFAYTFSPDYDRQVIELKPAFFKETNDGEIILKFHFWNGDVVSYKITKKGSSIVGEPALFNQSRGCCPAYFCQKRSFGAYVPWERFFWRNDFLFTLPQHETGLMHLPPA
ncbi:hypothetical protein D1872_269620 [compost metagenome]